MPNRLAQSTSPYLLQHQDTPVDWQEWGPLAFEEARRRDVPVLLSVGYAACHWCHVMAHESFEHEPTAAVMNEHFVPVKVDREERPDVDAVYMDAVQSMTGQGGWPMTVFLTPDAEPFYAGTYFPPQPRHGLPSFSQVLLAVSEAWAERRDEVRGAAARVTERLAAARHPDADTAAEPPDDADLDAAIHALAGQFDHAQAGFGGAPKFPPSMTLEQLLRHHARTGDTRSLGMASDTFEAMARGGLYDQLGGGFARYSTDAAWVVPHFEKMLYDNALLLRAYTGWWRATGSPLAARVVEETAGFLLRDLRTGQGGFASALDADSEGVEGRYYVWTPQQLVEVLGPDDGAWAAQLLEVTEQGTFEHGSSVLQLPKDPDDRPRWERVREALAAASAQRVPPARDDKVVAAWNGLAVAVLADAGSAFDRPDWVAAAEAAADLLVSVHLGADGRTDRMVRVSRNGVAGRHAGVLEDQADVAEGFLALLAATGDDTWLRLARVLLDGVLAHFADGSGGFYDTADDAEALLRRPQDPTDNTTPSGQAAAAGALLRFAAYTGSGEHRVAAERALAPYRMLARRYPRFAGWGLAVAEAVLDGPREVAVVGSPDDPATALLLRTAARGTAPGLVVATADPARPSGVPLMAQRPRVDGRPAAYVCRGFVCDAPTTDPAALAAAVGALR